jgi:hypothetical protein
MLLNAKGNLCDDHYVANCKAEKVICDMCANDHRTADCMQEAQKSCTPCQQDGHASWNIACPTFLKKCKELNDRLSNNTLLFFSTNEPWMQTREGYNIHNSNKRLNSMPALPKLAAPLPSLRGYIGLMGEGFRTHRDSRGFHKITNNCMQ